MIFNAKTRLKTLVNIILSEYKFHKLQSTYFTFKKNIKNSLH